MPKLTALAMDDMIRSILAQHGRLVRDAAELDENDDLFRIGLTSHATIDVMLAVEEAFEIEFPDEMFRKSTFQSVSAIRTAVSELGGAGVSA